MDLSVWCWVASDYIGPDLMTHWIIEESQGLPMWGCLEYQKVLGLMCI